MNMNATAQMVTTTQVGCGTFHKKKKHKKKSNVPPERPPGLFELWRKCLNDAVVNEYKLPPSFEEFDREILRLESCSCEVFEEQAPYPVPPHTMTNRGHLRDIG